MSDARDIAIVTDTPNGTVFLSKEDIKSLSDVLVKINPSLVEDRDPPRFNRDEEFKEYFKYFMSENADKLQNMTLRDICYSMWVAAWTKTEYDAVEVPMEEVSRMVDAEQFLQDIKCMIDNPAENCSVDKSSDGKVTLIIPCDAAMKDKCIAWPDRCEEAGGNGDFCRIKVRLETLIGDNPIIT